MRDYMIENASLEASFKALGAEWCSFVDKADGTEHLWQGNPEVWAYHAPVLFPVIGIQHGLQIWIDGKAYHQPKHGFFRDNVPDVIRHTEDEIIFELVSTPETKELYPFDMKFRVGFRLDGRSLENWFEIENTGDVAMPYQVGAHPAFNICLNEGESLEDYFVEFDEAETAGTYGVSPTGQLDAGPTPYLENQKTIRITKDLFNADALVFKSLKSKGIELASDKHGKRIRVDFPDFGYLGIWAKPGAKYVCIEPWNGCPDTVGNVVEYVEKDLVRHVAPGHTHRVGYRVTLLP